MSSGTVGRDGKKQYTHAAMVGSDNWKQITSFFRLFANVSGLDGNNSSQACRHPAEVVSETVSGSYSRPASIAL